MKQDDRARFDQALQRARVSVYAPGEFVEQESFMRAGEIRTLAARAGIAPGVRVLDLCCGVAGPGRFITQEFGCTYLGVDFSSSAIHIARERADELPCRFKVARIPPVPPGPFDVVLLLETMLAFPEKETLLQEISRALTTGGRFAFTMEEGVPLTEAERASMPDADTVWLTALPEMLTCLERVGLAVRWQEDCSRSHRAMADSLIDAFAADATAIAAQIGRQALDELLAAHRLWSDWLRDGRVRKIAFVAEKAGTKGPPRTTAAESQLTGTVCRDPAQPSHRRRPSHGGRSPGVSPARWALARQVSTACRYVVTAHSVWWVHGRSIEAKAVADRGRGLLPGLGRCWRR